MICELCGELTWGVFCPDCESRLLRTRGSFRRVGDLQIISIFPYSKVRKIINQKHSMRGWLLMRRLAQLAAYQLKGAAHPPLIPCEPRIITDYSHTFLICKILSPNQPSVGRLIDSSDTIYKGRTLAWRRANARRFCYHPPLRRFGDEGSALADTKLLAAQFVQACADVAATLPREFLRRIPPGFFAHLPASYVRFAAGGSLAEQLSTRALAAIAQRLNLRAPRAIARLPEGLARHHLRELLSRARPDIFAPAPAELALVDDLITTGTTLAHAQKALQRAGIKCRVAYTLADADM